MKGLPRALLLLIFLPFCSIKANWELLHQNHSIKGVHVVYREKKEHQPVFNSYLRKHIFNHQIIKKVLLKEVNLNLELLDSLLGQKHEFKNEVIGHWKESNGAYLPAVSKELWVNDDYPYQLIFTQEVPFHLQALYAAVRDTIASCSVFYPNPIASSQSQYGGPYADNNNSNNNELQEEVKKMEVRLAFNDSQNFELSSPEIKMLDISQPQGSPPILSTGQFHFNRSEQSFEQVNAYFHLINFMDYLKEDLGFENIFKKQIQVDAHALAGADNSIYIGITNYPQILFGDGGVDDAEDGQVIIHELAHAISDATSPYSNYGIEREAVDEGIGDYFAASYTKALTNSSEWYKVPSWDGHNEFWEGRAVNSTKNYSENLTGNKYQDSEIWSSVMMNIEQDLGRDLTHQILIESTFMYHENQSMMQAAEYFLKADSLLNNAENYQVIQSHFCAKKMTRDCDSSSYFKGNVTVDHNYLSQGLVVFSKNILQFTSLKIYNATGALVLDLQGEIPGTLDLRYLSVGVYFIQLEAQSNTQLLKIILL